jgi:hypothetical protein
MAETVVHFQLRMPPALHERLASQAKEEKSSLNAYIVSLLNGVVDTNNSPDGALSGLTAAANRDSRR